MEMQPEKTSYRIVRRAGYQGARPPVVCQAGVEKLTTGKERYSQPPHHSSVERALKIDSRLTRKKESKRNVSSSTPKQYCSWKVGTINVLTASDDLLLHECVRQTSRANLDICCFQEFRRLGLDSITIPIENDDNETTWNIWWTGHKRKRRDGVAIAIRKNKRVTVEDIGHVSARVMWIDCLCYGIKIRVVSAYAPTEEGSENQKDQFYKELNESCKLEEKRQLIVCGDMNATAEYCKSFVGGSNCSISAANNNGERFSEFLTLNDLCLSNTWYEHKKAHKDTWYSNTGNCSKTIDYISISKWINQFSIDCRVRRSYTFNNSDHRLLVHKFLTPKKRTDHKRFVKKQPKTKKFDVSGLKDEYILSNFVSKVDELCEAIETSTVGVKDCENLIKILENAASSTLPEVMKSAETKLWDHDDILVSLRNTRDSLDRHTQLEQFKAINKKIQNRYGQIRNNYYQGQAEKLTEAYEARNLEKLYRLSKTSCNNKKPVEQTCPGLREHFQAHFNHPSPSDEPPKEIVDPPEFIKRLKECGIASNEEMEQLDNSTRSPPKIDEIKKVLKKLKNKKASTDIPAEYIKAAAGSHSYMSALESMYKETWEEIVLAELWRKTTITGLFKNKGKRKETKNYRGLSIGSTLLKLAMAIILERIRHWYNKQLLPNQNGFRQFFGCPDAIFSVKSIQNISSRLKKEVYILFVDLTAAYDWCVRKWLFHSIFNRIDPENVSVMNCVKIMEELYSKTESVMKGETEYFETTCGVRQGGSESPNLFNLFLDYIMRIYNNEAEKLDLGVSFKFRIKDQARIRGDSVPYRGIENYVWFGYADDLALTANSKEKLQVASDLLYGLLKRFGLVVSLDKTKTMVLNYQGKDEDYPSVVVHMDGKPIENVKHFVYLGATIAFNEPGTSNKELDRRIGLAHGKFTELKKLLCNYHLALSIRMKFYDTYVRSRLCYCCETWTLTSTQYSRMDRVHMGFLRRMVRGGMSRLSSKEAIEKAKKEGTTENINWAWKNNNKKIYEITKTTPIQDYIMKQNTRWIGHVARASNDTLTKRLMFVDEKFTKRGNPHRTVLDNVVSEEEKKGRSLETFLRICTSRKSGKSKPVPNTGAQSPDWDNG